jgi:hypothetical protein
MTRNNINKKFTIKTSALSFSIGGINFKYSCFYLNSFTLIKSFSLNLNRSYTTKKGTKKEPWEAPEKDLPLAEFYLGDGVYDFPQELYWESGDEPSRETKASLAFLRDEELRVLKEECPKGFSPSSKVVLKGVALSRALSFLSTREDIFVKGKCELFLTWALVSGLEWDDGAPPQEHYVVSGEEIVRVMGMLED